MVVKAFPGKGQKHHTKHNFFFPDCYEATYTFYLGDMGHVSAQVHTQYPDKFLVSLNSRACCCKSLVQFTEALTLKSNQRPNTFSLPISVRICVGQKHSPLSSGWNSSINCVQGPFSTFDDTLLTITGGAGLFREARGVIHLHNITPFKLFYTFHVRGVPELPRILTSKPVEPNEHVQPRREAVACKPGFALPNYTD